MKIAKGMIKRRIFDDVIWIIFGLFIIGIFAHMSYWAIRLLINWIGG